MKTLCSKIRKYKFLYECLGIRASRSRSRSTVSSRASTLWAFLQRLSRLKGRECAFLSQLLKRAVYVRWTKSVVEKMPRNYSNVKLKVCWLREYCIFKGQYQNMYLTKKMRHWCNCMERKAATPAGKRDRRDPGRAVLWATKAKWQECKRRRRLVARPRKASACSGMRCQIQI